MVPYVFVGAALALRPVALQAALLPDRGSIHALERVGEARVVAEIIERRVTDGQVETSIADLDRRIKPLEGVVFLAPPRTA